MNLNPDAEFPAHNVQAAFSFPKAEEQVLDYWRNIDAFQESLRQSEGKPLYTFYDGPPFATGLPHHGHILMGTVKVRFPYASCQQTATGQQAEHPLLPRRTSSLVTLTLPASTSSVALAGTRMVCLSSTRLTKSSESRPRPT